MASILTGLSGVDTTLSALLESPLTVKQKNSIKVRQQLIEADRTSRPQISNIYRDTLRSMINIFSNFSYINSEEEIVDVRCIFANQERAIAKQFEEQNIILPVLSISQTTTTDDIKRGRYNSIIVQDKLYDEKKQRWLRIVSLPSKPITISYSLNIYSKYLSDMDQILEQVRFAFNPVLEVPTRHSTVSKAMIKTENDTGDTQIDDKQDRVLKKTLSIDLETWVPSPKFLLTSTGDIEIIHSPVEVSST